MINTLKEIASYLDDIEKNEVNTPIRLRSVLKNIDSDNILAYVKSFIMNTCNSMYKCSNIFGERICNDFIKSDFWKFNSIMQNDCVSYPELLSLTRKYLLIYVQEKLKNYDGKYENVNDVVPTHRVFYKAIANKRNKQEDRYFCVSDILSYSSNHFCQNSENCIKNKNLNLGSVLLLGLFDGHNGPEAAEHCHHLAPYLVSHHLQKSLCVKGYYNLIEALGETFYLLNFKLNGCRNKYRWKAGTTSTMCLIDEKAIYTSWVGDSSAWLIYKDNNQVPLTNILHRPSLKSEIIDVWNNGGIVTKSGKDFDRVNGILAVTRALGDDRKIVGVSALPSLSECRLTGNELCLVLATDGLWDSRNCSGPEIGDECREFLSSNNEDRGSMDLLCQAIVDRGVRGGASDNISLMLLVFDHNNDNDNNTKTELRNRTNVNSATVQVQRHDYNMQDSRSVQWPKDRRMSCFSQDLDNLRLCPDKLYDYVQIHFSNNAKMHAVIDDDDTRTRNRNRNRTSLHNSRSRSLSQGIQKRFSSPIRSITVADSSVSSHRNEESSDDLVDCPPRL